MKPAQGPSLIAPLFDPPVIVGEGTPDRADVLLPPEEAVAVANAVDKRRREFMAGRLLARAALERLGVGAHAIPMGRDRAPQWPDGVIGTISHTMDLCVVAVARRGPVVGLGVDVEEDSPLDPKLLPSICTARELAEISRLSPEEQGSRGKLLFTAKEAVYKCQYPLTGRFLSFEEVSIRFDFLAGTFEACEAGSEEAGIESLWPASLHARARFLRRGRHVASGVTLSIA